jgi:regulator of protease activity HflC (stomatin/prohibitin superfamily)
VPAVESCRATPSHHEEGPVEVSAVLLIDLMTEVGRTGAFGWVAGVAVLVGLVAAAVRVVPEQQRLVICRLGRVVRTAGPGLVGHLPLVERVTAVSVAPAKLRLTVSASTRDGVPVLLVATAACRVTAPGLSLLASPDPETATAAAVESRLARDVSRTELAALLDACADLESSIPAAISPVTATWGVQVTGLEVTHTEAALTPEPLRCARRQPPGKKRHARPPQGPSERGRP